MSNIMFHRKHRFYPSFVQHISAILSQSLRAAQRLLVLSVSISFVPQLLHRPAFERAFDVQTDHPVHFSRHYAGLIGIREG